MRRHRVPTQNCVLAHITVQMEALRQGAPVELLFQSLAGSEKANRNFGISSRLLDEAYDLVRREGTAQGPNVRMRRGGRGCEAGTARSADLLARCFDSVTARQTARPPTPVANLRHTHRVGAALGVCLPQWLKHECPATARLLTSLSFVPLGPLGQHANASGPQPFGNLAHCPQVRPPARIRPRKRESPFQVGEHYREGLSNGVTVRLDQPVNVNPHVARTQVGRKPRPASALYPPEEVVEAHSRYLPQSRELRVLTQGPPWPTEAA
jgi:hypothetical protein